MAANSAGHHLAIRVVLKEIHLGDGFGVLIRRTCQAVRSITRRRGGLERPGPTLVPGSGRFPRKGEEPSNTVK
jgi:hypothetical protein